VFPTKQQDRIGMTPSDPGVARLAKRQFAILSFMRVGKAAYALIARQTVSGELRADRSSISSGR
jgi:hypothetical protein